MTDNKSNSLSFFFITETVASGIVSVIFLTMHFQFERVKKMNIMEKSEQPGASEPVKKNLLHRVNWSEKRAQLIYRVVCFIVYLMTLV